MKGDKKNKNSNEAKREIAKFVEFAGSVRKAADLIGVKFQTIYGWTYDRSLVTERQATDIENITNGYCSKEILLLKKNIERNRKRFVDVIIKDHIAHRLRYSSLTEEEFFTDAIHPRLTEVIYNLSLIKNDEQLIYVSKLLAACCGSSPAYWATEIKKYKK